MKCGTNSELLRKTLGGIEFRYKLNDVISDLAKNNPKQKFSAKQLEGYLTKQGVSPKEIKASELFDNVPISSDSKETLTIKEWNNYNIGAQKIESQPMQGYDDIVLGGQGHKNPTYKVSEFKVTAPSLPTNRSHYFTSPDGMEEAKYIVADTKSGKASGLSQLGWHRTHQDNINGKPTTVLNEFQSDWLQAERQLVGTFESNVARKQKRLDEIKYNEMSPDTYNHYQDYKWEDIPAKYKKLINEVHNLSVNLSGETIADFPMRPDKFHQLMIVDSLNEAIENGTMRVAIPIQREGELAGSAGVTKFYDSLNKKILPDIRKKLEKQGLRLKLSKEDYKGYAPADPADLHERYMAPLGIEDLLWRLEDQYPGISDAHSWYDMTPVLDYTILVEHVGEDFASRIFAPYRGHASSYKAPKPQQLHVLEIIEIPNTKVKWDVYGLMGALGLGEYAESMKDNSDDMQ